METKKCPHCGRELPLSEFYCSRITGKAYTYCKSCSKEIKRKELIKKKERKEQDLAQHRLEGISARELILELRRRGYKGELVFQQKVKI